MQNIRCADGVVPNSNVVLPNSVHSGVILDDNEAMADEDGSGWLHRNDEYQMPRFSRRMTLTQLSGVENPQLSTIVNRGVPDYPFDNQC